MKLLPFKDLPDGTLFQLAFKVNNGGSDLLEKIPLTFCHAVKEEFRDSVFYSAKWKNGHHENKMCVVPFMKDNKNPYLVLVEEK